MEMPKLKTAITRHLLNFFFIYFLNELDLCVH